MYMNVEALYITLFIKKYIFRFQIAIDNILLVKIAQRRCNLSSVKSKKNKYRKKKQCINIKKIQQVLQATLLLAPQKLFLSAGGRTVPLHSHNLRQNRV